MERSGSGTLAQDLQLNGYAAEGLRHPLQRFGVRFELPYARKRAVISHETPSPITDGQLDEE